VDGVTVDDTPAKVEGRVEHQRLEDEFLAEADGVISSWCPQLYQTGSHLGNINLGKGNIDGHMEQILL
jgi:hypothetical protein